MRRMADVRHLERLLREPADAEHAAALGEAADERQPGLDLAARGPTIRLRTAGGVRMRRDEVPEQYVLCDPELV